MLLFSPNSSFPPEINRSLNVVFIIHFLFKYDFSTCIYMPKQYFIYPVFEHYKNWLKTVCYLLRRAFSLSILWFQDPCVLCVFGDFKFFSKYVYKHSFFLSSSMLCRTDTINILKMKKLRSDNSLVCIKMSWRKMAQKDPNLISWDPCVLFSFV